MILAVTGLTTVEKIVAVAVLAAIAYGAFLGKGSKGGGGGSSTPPSNS